MSSPELKRVAAMVAAGDRTGLVGYANRNVSEEAAIAARRARQSGDSQDAEQLLEIGVRVDMPITEAELLSRLLLRVPEDVKDRLCDQLWLMTILIEQRRRTSVAEREGFTERANKILALLDPGEVES